MCEFILAHLWDYSNNTTISIILLRDIICYASISFHRPWLYLPTMLTIIILIAITIS